MENTTCTRCGSVYKLREIKIPMRDKDSLACEICNNVLISWNGGVMYEAELLERKEYPTSESNPA